MNDIDWSKIVPNMDGITGTPNQEPDNEDVSKPAEPNVELTPEPEVPKYKIKYNHEEKELTVDELTKLAQLGMMYDNKVKPEYETITSEIDTLAKTFGMSKQEYLDAVKAQAEQYKIQQIQQQAQIPEAVAKEIYESRKFREQVEADKKAQQEKYRMQEMIDSFRQEYPGVTSDQIPVEVWQAVDNGSNLVDAYTKHQAKSMATQLAEMQKQIEQYKSGNINRDMTPGPITGNNATHKDITSDSISSMSSKDIVDNFDAVKGVIAQLMKT